MVNDDNTNDKNNDTNNINNGLSSVPAQYSEWRRWLGDHPVFPYCGNQTKQIVWSEAPDQTTTHTCLACTVQ